MLSSLGPEFETLLLVGRSPDGSRLERRVDPYRFAQFSKRFRQNVKTLTTHSEIALDGITTSSDLDGLCQAFNGSRLQVTAENVYSFLEVARQWDIPSLTTLCLQYFEEADYASQLLSEDNIQAYAKHFVIFTHEKYMSLGHGFFDQILARDDCLLPDNTHYLNFARSAIHHFGDDSSLILSKLNVTELAQSETSDLIGRLGTFSGSRIFKEILTIASTYLKERQSQEVKFSNANVQTDMGVQAYTSTELIQAINRGMLVVPYRPGNELNGIFRLLNFACGGNVHARGIVNVTGSSNAWLTPQNVVDFGSGIGWGSQGHHLGAWLQFDFKEKRIALSAYTLKTYNGGGYSSSHMKSWVVMGSNDNESSWNVIDERRCCDLLNGDDRFHTWRVRPSKPYKTIRIKQTAESHWNTASMWLNSVEFFGTLQ